jgi:hypothetical protein
MIYSIQYIVYRIQNTQKNIKISQFTGKNQEGASNKENQRASNTQSQMDSDDEEGETPSKHGQGFNPYLDDEVSSEEQPRPVEGVR